MGLNGDREPQVSEARQKALAYVEWAFLLAFAAVINAQAVLVSSCLEDRVFGSVTLAVQRLVCYTRAREGNSAVNFPGLSAVDLLQSYWHF